MTRFSNLFAHQGPIISREAYRAFITVMFSAAMLAWTATFLGFVTPFMPRVSTTSDSDSNASASTSKPAKLSSEEYKEAGRFPHGFALLVAILYGAVLICLYWIYSEKLATDELRPTNLLMLLFDFVALSFLAGASAAWRNEQFFVGLAIVTLFFLTCRFGVAAGWEIGKARAKEMLVREMLITHVVAAYLLCFIIIGCGLYLSNTSIYEPHTSQRLYRLICFGMVFGIGVTGYHSLSQAPPDDAKRRHISTPFEHIQPSLLPAYGTVLTTRLQPVANHIFWGEREFRRILCSVDEHWLSPFEFHQSRVHAYRDIETQAFIMAHHVDDDVEVKLRAMWVYLAHWFDDIFDDQYAGRLASMNLTGEFSIADTLARLDKRFERVWKKAVVATEAHAKWNQRLLETGMRRLILSGPMFSARCKSRHRALQEAHWKLIEGELTLDYGARELVNNIRKKHARYLEYTSKVVVEIWDSFTPAADFNLSMLMNLFYAPGLFYHDAEEENELDQVVLAPEEDENDPRLGETLDLVTTQIRGLTEAKLGLAAKPAPMFVRAFETILRRKRLLERYDAFLEDSKVKRVLRL